MITISAPQHFDKEIAYTLHVLLDHLGIPYSLSHTNRSNIEFTLENNATLILKTPFFNSTTPETYIQKCSIPTTIDSLTYPEAGITDLPILFGKAVIEESDAQIVCHADIIASIYFMLSRWEEVANKMRDNHNRFPSTASLSHTFKFLDRPIVNEYFDLIWTLLTKLGLASARKEQSFELVLTHDIDHIKFCKGLKHSLLILASAILKHRNITLFLNRAALVFNHWILRKKDPYNNLDWIMDLSDKYNHLSRFYFMSGGRTKYDNSYKIEDAETIIKKVIQRNHVVGFHPSYDAYNDTQQWSAEKLALEKVAGQSIYEGREHYLRFETPTTWQIWNDNNMKTDLTLCYADNHGFRCGTASPFPVFNCLTRTQLDLIETPLILMDTTLLFYQNLTMNAALTETRKYIEICKKHRMPLTFLAHNTMFMVKGFDAYYETVLSEC